MNEIFFFLAGDKCNPEMHLRQTRFTYSACGTFTKNNKRLLKLNETGGSKYFYRNELDKVCFQHHMAYGYFKYLPRRTASDKVLRNKAFNIAKNPKYDGYQRSIASVLLQLFISFLIKRFLVVLLKVRLFQTNLLWT